MLKEMKWNMLLSAALYMVLGLIMLIFPATTAHTICYLLAGIAIVIGLVNLVVYFTRSITHNYYRNDFVTGLMLMILGFFVIYQVDLVISLVPFIIGLCIIVSGLFKLQGALDVQRMGGNAVVILGVAVVTTAAGIGLSYCLFPSVNQMMIAQTGIPYEMRFQPLIRLFCCIACWGRVCCSAG